MCDGGCESHGTRHSIRGAVLAIAFIMAAAGARNVAGRGLENDDWFDVRTANFSLISNLSDRKTIEWLRHLEFFRAIVPLLTNIENLDAPIPTKISKRALVLIFAKATIRATKIRLQIRIDHF
jgi:hypothetical protein